MSPYKGGGVHQHTPEMEQALGRASGASVRVSFTPLLAPMPRGILATCSADLAEGVTTDDLRECLHAAYAGERFVHLLPAGQWPQTSSTLGGNAVHLHERLRPERRLLQVGLALMVALLAFVAVIALNAWLFQQVPKGIVPQQDTAQLRGFARGDDGLSFQAMQPKIDAYRKLLLSDPAIEDIIGYIGGSNGVNNAFIMIKMKPLAERKVSSQQVIDRLRELGAISVRKLDGITETIKFPLPKGLKIDAATGLEISERTPETGPSAH